MKLAKLQHDFRAWLTVASPEASLRLDREQRGGLAIYQNNYRAQLVGCLQSSYPLLSAWMGPELFREAAITHIDNRPPHAWTLDAYGADFEETLRALLPHNPDIHELAWIEWSLSESFVAADADAVSSRQLAGVDWDHARLHLAPSLRLRAASTHAEALWSALQQGDEAPASQMLGEAGGLITWRRDFTCRLKQIDAIEYAALLSLRDEDRFATLCDALVEHLGEEAGVSRAGALLADWIGSGIVTGITSA
jgi:hypothetical protein